MLNVIILNFGLLVLNDIVISINSKFLVFNVKSNIKNSELKILIRPIFCQSASLCLLTAGYFLASHSSLISFSIPLTFSLSPLISHFSPISFRPQPQAAGSDTFNSKLII